jgi:hypothetical protein
MKTAKPKFPTLFKVKLLKDVAHNSEGDNLEIKMVNSGDIYFYDGNKNWSFLRKEDEGKLWKRLNRNADVPKTKWNSEMPPEWE